MNVSSLFVENLRTSSIYSVNDICTPQYTLNSLGSYVYNVLNSSSIQGYAKLNTSNVFLYPPQSSQLPVLTTQLTTKEYVDNTLQSVDSLNHSWSGTNRFLNPITIINGIISDASSLNLSSSKQIGYTFESEWSNSISLNDSLQTLSTIVLNNPGVWQIHTQFEFSGQGIFTQMIMGYSGGIISREDIIISIETNEVIQRFVPSIITNQTGTNTISIVSSVKINAGTIYGRCKYFYVRIA